MVCPNCRAENPAQNSYCGRCGSLLAEASGGASRRIDRDSLIRREVVIITLGLLALMAAAVGAWYATIYRKSPTMVVRQFIEADRAGNNTLQQRLIASRWDSRLVLSALQTFRQQTGASPFQKYRILRTSEAGQTAYVDVEIQPAPSGSATAASPPSSLTVTFVLIREENVWKIDSTQTLASVMGALTALGLQQIGSSLPNILPPGGIPTFPLPPTILNPPPSSPPGSSAPPVAPIPSTP